MEGDTLVNRRRQNRRHVYTILILWAILFMMDPSMTGDMKKDKKKKKKIHVQSSDNQLTPSSEIAGSSTGPSSGDSNNNEHWGLNAGLERGAVGGIAANRSLQAAAGVWVAGDIANIDIGHKAIGRGMWTGREHALISGRVAARNMLGGSEMYSHLPATHLVCHTEREDSGSGSSSGGVPHVSLTTVGHCSAAQETHGYWWSRGTDGNDNGNGNGSGSSSGGVPPKLKANNGSGSGNGEGVKEGSISNIIKDQLWRYIGHRRGSDDGSGRMSSEDMRIAAKGKRASRRVTDYDAATAAANGKIRGGKERNGEKKEKSVPTRPPLGKGVIFGQEADIPKFLFIEDGE